MATTAVSSMRHACTGCGGSCQGVRVRVLPAEEAALQARAAELGEPNAVEEGRLRFVNGACVLLDAAGRCRIHAAYGAAAKPAVCRQYPLVMVDTGGGLRVGIDPGCYAAMATGAAPELEAAGGMAAQVFLDPTAERHEAALLAMLGAPGQTVAGVLTGLGVAPGFEERFLAAARRAPLAELLSRPDAGAAVRSALTAAVEALPAAAPPRPLTAEEDAWAVEVARRVVALRLCAGFPFLPGVVLLVLGGAVVCAQAPAFGPGMAGWSRALRAPAWWSALVPSPDALRGLMGA